VVGNTVNAASRIEALSKDRVSAGSGTEDDCTVFFRAATISTDGRGGAEFYRLIPNAA
jgi:class 3 adenylate cyclase